MPQQKPIHVRCPGCGGQFSVAPEFAGRRGRCTRCQTALDIPGDKSPPSETQLHGVLCRVCGTPLYGTAQQVGQPLKCPDCGARTKLPPPKKQRKIIPPAMQGEQYELWDAADDPYQSAQPVASEEQLPVWCLLCNTLMYAKVEQVGTELVCPDCGSRTQVQPPRERKKPGPVLVPDGQEYQMSALATPLATPRVISPETERHLLAEQEAGRGGSVHDSERERRAKQRRQLDSRGRPILPRSPTITGVVSILFSQGAPARWVAISLGMIAAGLLLAFSLASLGMAAPASLVSPDVATVIFAVFLLAIAAILGFIVCAAIAAHALAIVVESSEGNDAVAAWPAGNVMEWLPETGFLLLASMVSALPGWFIGKYAAHNEMEQVIWTVGGMLVCLPIVMLSQLEASSAANVLSGRIITSLVRAPVTWTLFYLESTMLAALCVAAFIAAAQYSVVATVLLGPLCVIALFLYFRLLGRLGWAIAEAMPVEEDEEVGAK